MSKFKEWFDLNYIDGWELDKDILGDDSIYSPETCCFVPRIINVFITARGNCRGLYPIGVVWHKRDKKFEASCNDPINLKGCYLGRYDTPEEAHIAWKQKKHEFALQLVYEFDKIDERVKESLSKRYKESK